MGASSDQYRVKHSSTAMENLTPECALAHKRSVSAVAKHLPFQSNPMLCILCMAITAVCCAPHRQPIPVKAVRRWPVTALQCTVVFKHMLVITAQCSGTSYCVTTACPRTSKATHSNTTYKHLQASASAARA
eukprot:14847-Heterococcus_DN1.PRE.2